MAIHHPTPPLGGGERPRLPSAQVGPVTQAIRAMRMAEPAPQSGFATQFTQGIRALSRTEVEDLIGGLIDLLDAMDGDADLEPSLAAPEPILGGVLMYYRDGRVRRFEEQEHWAVGATDDREDDAGDNREEENEHGGEIQDEPHDEEQDREPDFESERDTAPEWSGKGEHTFDHGGLFR